LRSLDVLSKISDESNQSPAGDEHLLRGIHAEAGVCWVITLSGITHTLSMSIFIF
jgi:hypothetical protein